MSLIHRVIDLCYYLFQEFASNLDPNTTSTTVFDNVFYARCVRVIPTERIGDQTALRLELLGCGNLFDLFFYMVQTLNYTERTN